MEKAHSCEKKVRRDSAKWTDVQMHIVLFFFKNAKEQPSSPQLLFLKLNIHKI
jgi:hypothetical protein